MAAHRLKRVVRRGVLERAAHPLLARYLSPFIAYLDAQAVDLAALRAAPQDDRAIPRRIDVVLHDASTRPPPELLESMTALDALATPEGATELVRVDRDRRLPRGTHGDEDLALVALLDHPDLARSARVAATRDAEHKFVECAPPPGTRRAPLDERGLASLRELLGSLLDELDHTAYCDVTLSTQDDELLLEIDHGSRPRTRELINPSSLRVAQITDVTARRAFARYHAPSGRLCIRAQPSVRRVMVRALGRVLAGNADAFRAEGSTTSRPSAISRRCSPRRASRAS